MHGLMQEPPLLVSSLIDHANACHPGAEIVRETLLEERALRGGQRMAFDRRVLDFLRQLGRRLRA